LAVRRCPLGYISFCMNIKPRSNMLKLLLRLNTNQRRNRFVVMG
jgi:hypothetical protein